MIYPTNHLLSLAIVSSDNATDGAIGDVKDLYLDDETWEIRFLAVETGSWRSSRGVLISPIASDIPDWAAKLLAVSHIQAAPAGREQPQPGQCLIRHSVQRR